MVCRNRRRRWHISQNYPLLLCRRLRRLGFWVRPSPRFAPWATNIPSALPTKKRAVPVDVRSVADENASEIRDPKSKLKPSVPFRSGLNKLMAAAPPQFKSQNRRPGTDLSTFTFSHQMYGIIAHTQKGGM